MVPHPISRGHMNINPNVHTKLVLWLGAKCNSGDQKGRLRQMASLLKDSPGSQGPRRLYWFCVLKSNERQDTSQSHSEPIIRVANENTCHC